MDEQQEVVIIAHNRGVEGQYLQDFNPDAHGADLYPTGWATFTDDLNKAKRFNGPADALKYIMQVPKICPVRPDGRPNKPLMAFTLEVSPIPQQVKL